jgi:hypothetical protein
VGDVHGSHDVCASSDGKDAGGGSAARFIAVAEEAMEAGVVWLVFVVTLYVESDLHSVTPALVIAFDVRIYIPYASG